VTFYLITVNYHSTELIRRLLNSLNKSQFTDRHFIIVNNSPEDNGIQQLQEEKVTVLEAGKNLGFGAGCNLGLEYVYQHDRLSIAWLINPDTWLPVDALKNAAKFFVTHPHLSIVGTAVHEPAGNLWFGGGRFNPTTGVISSDLAFADPAADYIGCDWVSGCSLLLNLHHFPACPQFDCTYFLYYEDFDFCRRYQQQGHTIVVTPQISVIHTPSAITDRDRQFKLKHSTYSYLLTLKRYTSSWVFNLRLGRLLLYALVLLPVQPQAAIGKLSGLYLYFTTQHQMKNGYVHSE
jgi:GT2 family glycosyltransferase